MDARDVFLFLGAGASFGGEAGLPLFWQIRAHIVDMLVPRTELDPRDELFELLVSKMAPESFFHAFATAGVDVVRALVETFNANAPRPNPVHRACASLLASGATVWTTNYDTLVEEACQSLGAYPSVWSSPDSPPGHYDIAKPHGSLPPRVAGEWAPDSSPNLVFETNHLLADLPGAWEAALISDVERKGIVVIGYSGADIDIAPHLARALDAAYWVVWFATPPEEARLLHRYQLNLRSGPRGDPALSLTDNPAESFLAWLERHQLFSTQEPCPPNWRPNLGGFDRLVLPELARADVLANLGLARTSESLYRDITRSAAAPLRDRLTASLRMARRNATRLRHRKPAAVFIRGFSALPGRAPGVAVARRLAAEDTRSAETWPTTDVLWKWFNATDPRTYRGIGLGLIRRLRYEGRLEEARELAESLLRDSRFDHPSPSHVAGFSFQLTEIFRMQGRMNAAEELIERGFARLLGTSLVLWEEFESLACRIQRFDLSVELDDQLLVLARAFSRINEPLGQETISMAEAIHRRQMGDHPGALVILMLLAEATRSTSPLLHNEALFHSAETFRLLGEQDAALEHLARIDTRWYLHDPFVKVCRVLINPAFTDASELLRDAHAQFMISGCPWGEAMRLMWRLIILWISAYRRPKSREPELGLRRKALRHIPQIRITGHSPWSRCSVAVSLRAAQLTRTIASGAWSQYRSTVDVTTLPRPQ